MQIPTITSLREKIYPIVDHVIATGSPASFTKDGFILKISVEKKPGKLANLQKQELFKEDPEKLIHLKLWEWHEPKNLK
ncbi:MAG: hypothetical protein O3B87_02385 [bacterium]|nr:hypothetical protein [bacterium]